MNDKPLYALLVPLAILVVQLGIGISMILIGVKAKSPLLPQRLERVPYLGWFTRNYFVLARLVTTGLGSLLVIWVLILIADTLLGFFLQP